MNAQDAQDKTAATFAEVLTVFIELFLVQEGIEDKDEHHVVIDFLQSNHGPIFTFLKINRILENKEALRLFIANSTVSILPQYRPLSLMGIAPTTATDAPQFTPTALPTAP